MSTRSRCAACRSLRRKCTEDCIVAPHFPSSDPERFDSVHKIFGTSNVTKMLQQLPEHLRADAAESISYEAMCRMKDPVFGCVGIISQLQQQITDTQTQLMKTKGELAFYTAQSPPKDSDATVGFTAHQEQSPCLGNSYPQSSGHSIQGGADKRT